MLLYIRMPEKMLLAGKSLSFVLTPTPAIELGGSLIRNTDINLAGYVLTMSGNGQVGIGLTSPSATSKVQSGVPTSPAAPASSSSSRILAPRTGFLFSRIILRPGQRLFGVSI
jgi:hypothetical protein